MSLFHYVAPLLREDQVYPTRIPVSIKDTFLNAAIAVDSFERLQKERSEIASTLLNSIGTASQLILDASSYLFKNKQRFNEWTNKEIKLDYRFDFIMIYKTVFPEVDIEKIRQIPLIAPIFAQKTRDLARKLTNPERLTEEEKDDLTHKLIEINNSINREQYRANR